VSEAVTDASSDQDGPASSEPIDVAARLRRTAAERPDHPALVAGSTSWTYGELHARVDAATAVLQELGVAPGDRVGLVLGTTPAFVVAACAVLRTGGALVPLLPGLAPDELRHALADSGAEVVVAGPERAAEIAACATNCRPASPVDVRDHGRGCRGPRGPDGGSGGSRPDRP
jgi:acyl-CoA synthetase (AMP-forming)/AMP-acid ligase II